MGTNVHAEKQKNIEASHEREENIAQAFEVLQYPSPVQANQDAEQELRKEKARLNKYLFFKGEKNIQKYRSLSQSTSAVVPNAIHVQGYSYRKDSARRNAYKKAAEYYEKASAKMSAEVENNWADVFDEGRMYQSVKTKMEVLDLRLQGMKCAAEATCRDREEERAKKAKAEKKIIQAKLLLIEQVMQEYSRKRQQAEDGHGQIPADMERVHHSMTVQRDDLLLKMESVQDNLDKYSRDYLYEAVSKISEDQGKASTEFARLRARANRVRQLSQGRTAEELLGDREYQLALAELEQANSAYMDRHKDDKGAIKKATRERKKYSARIKKYISRYYQENFSVHYENGEVFENHEKRPEYQPKDLGARSTARQKQDADRWFSAAVKLLDLKASMDYFVAHEDSKVTSDPLTKINSKLVIFENYRDAFAVYQKRELITGLNEEAAGYVQQRYAKNVLSKSIPKILNYMADLYAEYHNLLAQKYLLEDKLHLQAKEEGKAAGRQIDDSLTPEQLHGIEDLDRWLVRNMNNGGPAGYFKESQKNNKADFVVRLLSLTKRERLNIYYLIESRTRKCPAIDGVAKAQLEYVPNLGKFKSQMIATKFKFITHCKGSYIYWDKLGEALQVTERQAGMIEILGASEEQIDRRILENRQLQSGRAEEAGEDHLQEMNRQADHLMLEILCMLKMLVSINKAYEQTNNPVLQEDYRRTVEALKDRCRKAELEFKTGDQNFSKEKTNEDTIFHIASAAKGMEKAEYLNKISFINRTVPYIPDAIDPGGGLGSVLTAVASAVSYIVGVSAGTLSEDLVELGSLLTELARGANHVNESVTSVAGMANSDGLVKASESAAVVINLAYGGVMAAYGLGQMVNGTFIKGKRLKDAKRAIDRKIVNSGPNTEEERAELRFQEGQLRLSENYLSRQKKRGLLNTLTGIAYVSAIFVPATVFVSMGVTLGNLVVSTCMNSDELKKLQRDLFDRFYQMDEAYQRAFREEGENRRRDGIAALNEDDRKQIQKELRSLKIAKLGFASLDQASLHCATVYATRIYERLTNREIPDEDADLLIYKKLVNSLGLEFNREKGRPKIRVLARRMSGH